MSRPHDKGTTVYNTLARKYQALNGTEIMHVEQNEHGRRANGAKTNHRSAAD